MTDPPTESENLRQWLRILSQFLTEHPFNKRREIDDVTRWAILSSIAARALRNEPAPADAKAYECVTGWFSLH